MARKRKSPERKSTPRAIGFLSSSAAAITRVMARHPFVVGGTACFAVVFGFVAANALWYQPGRHPSPLLRTRDVTDFNALAGLRRNSLMDRDPAEVTTYRIERESAPSESSAAGAAGAQPTDGELTLAVQRELASRGLYSGAADGVTGPLTSAAIAAFQKSVGMAETGKASSELLAALQVDSRATAALPLSRPSGDLHSAEAESDPVAAAIRSAEVKVVPAVAKPKLAPVANANLPGNAGLVMEIQRGLANIAYADVSVDGVAGEQTRAAIRHFEKHYRLPETGEPNEAVLKKLKSIGAL